MIGVSCITATKKIIYRKIKLTFSFLNNRVLNQFNSKTLRTLIGAETREFFRDLLNFFITVVLLCGSDIKYRVFGNSVQQISAVKF